MKSLLRSALRLAGAAALATVLLSAGGCASVQARHPGDPWEPMNRSVSQLNEGVDTMVLRPAATAYRQFVPPLVRTGVANFFGNLGDMWSFVNSALQGKLPEAMDNFARVQINTFVGLGGIFDIASDLHIDRHREDFGQTLGAWGVPAGPYLVLPLLGPSTLRDALALPVDWKGDPVGYVDPSGVRGVLTGVRVVHQRSTVLRVGIVMEEAALDRYTFTRDAYLQRRRAEVYESEDPRRDIPPPLPVEPAAAGETPAAAPPPARP